MTSVTNYATRVATYEISGCTQGNSTPTTVHFSFRARDLTNGVILVYNNDPDLLIRFKHLLLGISTVAIIVPIVIIQSFAYLAKWFDGTAQAYDTPQHALVYHLSLLRWNLVGLIFPQFGRLHFGDEERQEHILHGGRFTMDLQSTDDSNNDVPLGGRLEDTSHHIYRAPCFQPITRLDNTNLARRLTNYVNHRRSEKFVVEESAMPTVTPVEPRPWFSCFYRYVPIAS